MGHDVALEVVDINKRNAKRTGHALGEVHTYQEGPHESRAAGEGYCRQHIPLDTGFAQGGIDNGDNILLMSPGC